jgi:hypothetical protein
MQSPIFIYYYTSAKTFQIFSLIATRQLFKVSIPAESAEMLQNRPQELYSPKLA